MKRIIIWILGVALCVFLALGGVMGVSYALTPEQTALPAAQVIFCGQPLTPARSCWEVPLVGGVLDKRFVSVSKAESSGEAQQLGTLIEAHPSISGPDWATEIRVTVRRPGCEPLFEGDYAEYNAFLYPENGDYEVTCQFWRLPEGMSRQSIDPARRAKLRVDPGVERPARARGFYEYHCAFTLHAAPEIELSAEELRQGEILGIRVTGMIGAELPVVETELGPVGLDRCPGGWRGYIPAAYNASAGDYPIQITINGESITRMIRVAARNFGEAEAAPEPAASEKVKQEYRNVIWPLYDQPATPKQWQGGWQVPVENSLTLIGYGQVKVTNGVKGSRSNSTLLYTIPGDPVAAPASGRVVVAQELGLTGKTVVIDHGCGLRSYLYGLSAISVQVGDNISKSTAVGAAGEELTMDFKIGSKSIDPMPLFRHTGGLFWKEDQ